MMTGMKRCLLALLAMLVSVHAMARPSLVCRITARIPFTSDRRTLPAETRVFVQTAGLLEERRSGDTAIYHWNVIADRPDQLMAVDPTRALTLLIDRPGNTFEESGLMWQRRGYCRVNDLP